MERDGMGQAVVNAASQLRLARETFKRRFPLGPGRVRMTPSEARRAIERNPQNAQLLLQQLGVEGLMKLLQGQRPAGPDIDRVSPSEGFNAV